MILITGAAGFIGSYTVGKFNEYRVRDLLLCDDFSRIDKMPNHENKKCLAKIERSKLFEELPKYTGKIETIIHLGARTDTTEMNHEIFDELNVEYSKKVWKYCTENRIAFIYASSAATYGNGEKGYSDYTLPSDLKPMNPYGESKNDFDVWALEQTETPPYWCGMKFFNVYGPNEYHKGRMASVVYHAYKQILETGKIKLFKSHKEGIEDGMQQRDFIYVNDIAEFIWFNFKRQSVKGLLNLGTGKARSFLDLANAVFDAMGKEPNIEFVDTPLDLRENYQYFTQAETKKFETTGFNRSITSLEEGIERYVKDYLMVNKCY